MSKEYAVEYKDRYKFNLLLKAALENPVLCLPAGRQGRG